MSPSAHFRHWSEIKGQLSNPTGRFGKLLELWQRLSQERQPARKSGGESGNQQKQTRLTDDEISELVKAYQKGRSVRELALEYQIHRTTVLSHLDRNGMTRRPNRRKLTDKQVARAALLYESGLSLAIVGQKFGVDAATIRKEILATGQIIRARHGRSTPVVR